MGRATKMQPTCLFRGLKQAFPAHFTPRTHTPPAQTASDVSAAATPATGQPPPPRYRDPVLHPTPFVLLLV